MLIFSTHMRMLIKASSWHDWFTFNGTYTTPEKKFTQIWKWQNDKIAKEDLLSILYDKSHSTVATTDIHTDSSYFYTVAFLLSQWL